MTLLDRNLPQHTATSVDAAGPLPAKGAGYFARHRLMLYLLLGVGIVAAVALNWNWLAAAGLLPLVAFLPCMMMFMCMKHGTRSPKQSDETLMDVPGPRRSGRHEAVRRSADVM